MAKNKSIPTNSELHNWLNEGGDLFQLANDHAIKRDSRLFSSLFSLNDEQIFCKCFSLSGVKGRLQRWFGLDRARRLHQKAEQLFRAEVPVAEPLGYLVQRDRAYWFSAVLPFRNLLYWTGSALPDTEAERGELVDASLSAMVALHKAGFGHGDFKWGNLLYDPRQKKIWLVDLDRVSRRKSDRYDQGAARDLARFVLDCEEAGVPESELRLLAEKYSARMAESVERVVSLYEPIYQKLKARHIHRYGEGFRLSPPEG